MDFKNELERYEVLKMLENREEFTSKEASAMLKSTCFAKLKEYLEVVRVETFEVKGKTRDYEIMEMYADNKKIGAVDIEFYYSNKRTYETMNIKVIPKIIKNSPVYGKRYYYRVKPEVADRLFERIGYHINDAIRDKKERISALECDLSYLKSIKERYQAYHFNNNF